MHVGQRGLFRADPAVNKHGLAKHEGAHGLLLIQVVDRDIGIGANAQMPLIFEVEHCGRIQGALFSKFAQGQAAELDDA